MLVNYPAYPKLYLKPGEFLLTFPGSGMWPGDHYPVYLPSFTVLSREKPFSSAQHQQAWDMSN